MELGAKDLQHVTPPKIPVKLWIIANGTGLRSGEPRCEIRVSHAPMGHLEQVT